LSGSNPFRILHIASQFAPCVKDRPSLQNNLCLPLPRPLREWEARKVYRWSLANIGLMIRRRNAVRSLPKHKPYLCLISSSGLMAVIPSGKDRSLQCLCEAPFYSELPCSRSSPGRERPSDSSNRDRATPAVVLRTDSHHPNRRNGRSRSPRPRLSDLATRHRPPSASRHPSASRRSRSPSPRRDHHPSRQGGNFGGRGPRGRGDNRARPGYRDDERTAPRGGRGDRGGDRGGFRGIHRSASPFPARDNRSKATGFRPSSYEERQQASRERETQRGAPPPKPARNDSMDRNTRFSLGSGPPDPPGAPPRLLNPKRRPARPRKISNPAERVPLCDLQPFPSQSTRRNLDLYFWPNKHRSGRRFTPA